MLERETGSLRVEEVDQRDEARVEDAKVDVSLVADGFDRDWGDFDDEEGELGVSDRILVRLTIQFEAEASAAADARIGRGEYSEGSNQGMANNPTAKKKLQLRQSRTKSQTPT